MCFPNLPSEVTGRRHRQAVGTEFLPASAGNKGVDALRGSPGIHGLLHEIPGLGGTLPGNTLSDAHLPVKTSRGPPGQIPARAPKCGRRLHFGLGCEFAIMRTAHRIREGPACIVDIEDGSCFQGELQMYVVICGCFLFLLMYNFHPMHATR